MRPNVSDFFSYCLILVLTSLASLTLGVFVGSVSQHVVLCLIIRKTHASRHWTKCCSLVPNGHRCCCLSLLPHALGLTPVPAFEVPMIMFSGLLYERSSVPAWLAWIEKVSVR